MTAGTLPRHHGIAIRLRQKFRAPRERVFHAWTDPEALKRWWCPEGFTPEAIEIDLRVGGAYKFGMRRTAGGPPVVVRGSFLEVDAPQRLVYTWQWEGAFNGMPLTRVQVQFRESGGTTEVTLIHENFPEVTVCLEHRAGWLAAWKRIEAAMEAAMGDVR